MAAHAHADNRYLRYLVVARDIAGTDMRFHALVQHFHRLRIVAARHGEGEVGFAVHRLVLNDHVDFDVRIGDRAEYLVGDAGAIRHRHDGDFFLVAVDRDTGTG